MKLMDIDPSDGLVTHAQSGSGHRLIKGDVTGLICLGSVEDEESHFDVAYSTVYSILHHTLFRKRPSQLPFHIGLQYVWYGTCNPVSDSIRWSVFIRRKSPKGYRRADRGWEKR
jgi:hypothetical protein